MTRTMRNTEGEAGGWEGSVYYKGIPSAKGRAARLSAVSSAKDAVAISYLPGYILPSYIISGSVILAPGNSALVIPHLKKYSGQVFPFDCLPLRYE